jgi:surface antigen
MLKHKLAKANAHARTHTLKHVQACPHTHTSTLTQKIANTHKNMKEFKEDVNTWKSTQKPEITFNTDSYELWQQCFLT